MTQFYNSKHVVSTRKQFKSFSNIHAKKLPSFFFLTNYTKIFHSDVLITSFTRCFYTTYSQILYFSQFLLLTVRLMPGVSVCGLKMNSNEYLYDCMFEKKSLMKFMQILFYWLSCPIVFCCSAKFLYHLHCGKIFFWIFSGEL